MQTTGSSMTGDGTGINVTISLGCPTDTGGGTGCASITATLRDGSVINWPNSGTSTLPTWTDSNGNRITYNATSNGFSITDTLGTTALTYSAPSGSRSGTYTSPYGTPASVTMLFQSYNWQTDFQCPGVLDYPVENLYWLPY
jgi:hypothetical protein